MKIAIEITSAKLAAFFTNAIECNSMTTAWCSDITISSEAEKPYSIWYADPKFWETKYTITVKHDGQDSEEGARDVTTTITNESVRTGLELMATKFPRHFGDMISESGDNITSDVMLQCIVLRDVIFG